MRNEMNEAQKHALRFMFSELFEADEPEAMLHSFKRIAEVQAYQLMKGPTTGKHDVGRWLKLAEILTKVEDEYMKPSEYDI
jgi:hypothetical protein